MNHLTFTQALTQAEAQARSTLDVALHERLSCAVALVKAGRVVEHSAAGWQVDSSSREGVTYTVNGTCNCDDVHYNQPPKGLCKHRLAVYLCRRTMQLMQQPPVPVVPEAVPEPYPDNDPGPEPPCPPAPLPEAPATGIDPRHIVVIQSKPFVKFAGLLERAHQRGLQSLTVEWTFNDAELSLAHAVAVFPFGRFEESGDATPANVNKKVAPHFRRCALTRAAARCLRLALGLDMIACVFRAKVATDSMRKLPLIPRQTCH
jgi:hypothetical protein